MNLLLFPNVIQDKNNQNEKKDFMNLQKKKSREVSIEAFEALCIMSTSFSL